MRDSIRNRSDCHDDDDVTRDDAPRIKGPLHSSSSCAAGKSASNS